MNNSKSPKINREIRLLRFSNMAEKQILTKILKTNLIPRWPKINSPNLSFWTFIRYYHFLILLYLHIRIYVHISTLLQYSIISWYYQIAQHIYVPTKSISKSSIYNKIHVITYVGIIWILKTLFGSHKCTIQYVTVKCSKENMQQHKIIILEQLFPESDHSGDNVGDVSLVS